MYFLHCLLTCLFCCFGVSQITLASGWDKRVHLATYPRSGNHWMRYLIEEVTDVATGSVYIDGDAPRHLPTRHPWGYSPDHGYEGNRRYPTEDDLLIIKTHFPCIPAQQLDNQSVIKAIRVIRHPIDSCYSYYSYCMNTHSLLPSEIVPEGWVNYFIASWRKFQEYWNQQPNVLTIRYEDLYNSPSVVLKQVFEAIGYPATAADIQRAITKYPPQGGLLKHLHRFEAADITRIETELRDLMDQYHYSNFIE